MSSPVDDLPWPELGNVSRGATRGNQGQKGVLGPPDREGRCILQLRVQPGVLAVRLNRQASDWYRTLDNEVNAALKSTKTFWRKARRRQDYDARADQDHMELHEWLQQLKDKTMSHLELLMQKGDIQGPPYIMPDDIELTFLRKFIERQAAGLPHNPRLRNASNMVGDNGYHLREHDHSVESGSPEPSDHSYLDQGAHSMSDNQGSHMLPPRHSLSPSLRNPESLSQEASSSKQALQMARTALARAQKDTQDAFMRYTACMETERLARQAVSASEKHRDDVMGALLTMNQPGVGQQSRHSSVSLDDHQSVARYHVEDMKPRSAPKSMEWPDNDSQGVYATESMSHLADHSGRRKHSRTWENGPQMTGLESHYGCEDMMPPRKRIHHMMSGYDMGNTVIQQQQNMTMPS